MATKITKAKTTKAVSVPAGVRWTSEDAQKALEKHAFIRVGGKNVTYRYISGALRSWNSDKSEERSTLFNVKYRITGTPDKITEALEHAGLSAEQISAVLAESVSGDNIQNPAFAQLYQTELDSLTSHRKTSVGVEPQPSYSASQIIDLADRMKNSTITRPTKTGGKTTPTAGTLRGPSLKERISTLGADKVLDVSNMDRQTGKNVRSVARPKSSRGGKFLSQDVPIVSNNLDTFISAIQLIYGSTTGQTATVSEAEKFFTQGGTKTKKPKSPKEKKIKVAGEVKSCSPTRVVPGQSSPPRQRSPVVVCPVPRVASPVTTRGGITLPSIASLRR